MTEKYVCSICEKGYDNLTSYMACVSKCGEKILQEQKEAEQKKYLEEVNAYLNKIKAAEKYLKEVQDEFKKKFPKEFELNFGKNVCSCDSHTCNCKSESDLTNPNPNPKEKERFKDISLSYVDNGKDKPKLSAKVNGVKVDDDSINKLFDDPDTRYIAKLLGII